MDAGKIRIIGARVHNLRNLSLEIPRNRLVVITGVSGSGKSSLAFDTLYAEGQRRYVESLSAYARQFLERLEKPDVNSIEGLSPAIAIEQRTSTPNPRSTVATTTEIYDYLRVIYAAAGQPHDPQTGTPLIRRTIPEIAEVLIAAGDGAKLVLLAPVPESEWRGSGGLKSFLARLKKQGFIRVRIAGEIHDIEEIDAAALTALDDRLERSRAVEHGENPDRPVEIVIDRLTARAEVRGRLIDSVRTALRQSGHEVRALIGDAGGGWREERFSTEFTNPSTGFRLPELTPRHFSFNSHSGACPVCQGLGTRLECDPALLVADPRRSIADGAVKSWWARNPKLFAVHKRQLSALVAHFAVDESAPFESLPSEFKTALFYGTKTPIRTGWKTGGMTRSLAKPFEGLCRQAERLHETSESEFVRMNVARFMNPKPCPACGGRRLKPEILAVTLRGGLARSVGVPPMSPELAEAEGAGLHGPEGHATAVDHAAARSVGVPPMSGESAGAEGAGLHGPEGHATVEGRAAGRVGVPPMSPELAGAEGAGLHGPEGHATGSAHGPEGHATVEGRAAARSVGVPPMSGELSIDRLCGLSISETVEWLRHVHLSETQRLICAEPLKEVGNRLRFLEDVGLGYLTLNREMGTLSGGEAQRIRLATQIGSGLSGVLYVLDEPSIGLHQRDNARLIGTLQRLRDLGNTVIVVEHDEETIRAADHVIDLGPGAGPHGGRILAQGTPAEVMADEASLTGRYLAVEDRARAARQRMPELFTHHLTVHGASENNLDDITVSFPIGALTCVSGVSGSGKSTLVDDILRRALARHFYGAKEPPGRHREITGLDQLDKLVMVDQSPIGRSPRSNPVTYLGVFTAVRELFSELPAARVRGFTPGTFSFNTPGGRCEACEGDGQIRIDMHFLSDVFVTCEACGGLRYQRDVLDVTYKGRNIADVLAMTFEEAAAFFRPVPQISEKLRTTCLTGLGYLKLGQPANTLSGGEAQRIKLAAELGKRSTGRTLYILDEPTTGLHFQDIEVLLGVLFRLRDAGNSLIVIEHNLDVIRAADWVVDLGPGGGADGGKVVASGTPAHVAAEPSSATGYYLRRWYAGSREAGE